MCDIDEGVDGPEASPPGSSEATKRPYTPPVLIEWGTLRDITEAVGWTGASDGGKGKQPRRTR